MSSSPTRMAVPGDAGALVRITAACSAAPQWTAAQIDEVLRASAEEHPALRRTVLVCELAGAVTGFAVVAAVCAVDPVEAELESVAVDPEYQGQGIGLGLLHASFDWAALQGAASLRLEVRAGNQRALRLYQRAGFRRTGLRAGYYSAPVEDAILLEHALPRDPGAATPLA